jgi:glycosyltransferase involved in cell wall biosynthesis
MKVVHVDPAPTWRGGERQVLLLAKELARLGVEGPVVAAPEDPLARRVAAEGLPLETASARGDLDPGAVARLGRLYRRHRPDVIHLHTARAHAVGGLAARLAGISPVLVTRRLELPVRGFGRWKYRHLADHFIAISSAVEASLWEGGVTPDRVTLIPSGIPVPLPGPRRRREAARPRVVGTLAAFTRQKGPEAWLETVQRVAERDADVRFVWAGDGELRDGVEVAVERAGLGGRIDLPGFLEDPEAFWEQVDLFFLPSTFEALGTVLLDALAREIPVVATPVGGIPEVVRDGREGLIAATPPELAERILRILRDPELAERLGAAGKQRAEGYRIDRLAERVAALYHELTGGGRE